MRVCRKEHGCGSSAYAMSQKQKHKDYRDREKPLDIHPRMQKRIY